MSNPSRLYLQSLETPPATILEHLIAHFPRVLPDVWQSRVARGRVTLSDGTIVTPETPYRHGVHVHYWRELSFEPPAVEQEVVIYEDDEILVADKPHGMPVIPSGPYLDRTLLLRLQKRTSLASLAPMHRLDRETAGLVLFNKRPEHRGLYHQLFAEGRVEREYMALAEIGEVPSTPRWLVENRIEPGDPWFRQKIVEGPVNAVTEIALVESNSRLSLFRLLPKTGKKHQLRLHMASIGFPILGDALYPEMREKRDGELPLQLIANRLEFVDPLSGMARFFRSLRRLTA